MTFLSLDDALSLEGFCKRKDLPFTVKPSMCDIVFCDKVSPIDYTATVFVVGIDESNKFVLAHNRRRGIEIAGGHIENNETIYEAAARELLEETGYIAHKLYPLCFERIISGGVKPENYKYSFPYGFQQFFFSRVTFDKFSETDECKEPKVFSYQDFISKDSPFDSTRKEIMKMAARKFHELGSTSWT